MLKCDLLRGPVFTQTCLLSDVCMYLSIDPIAQYRSNTYASVAIDSTNIWIPLLVMAAFYKWASFFDFSRAFYTI